MEQPERDSEADVLQRLEGFFGGEQAAPQEEEAAVEAQQPETEVADDEQPAETSEITPDEPGLVELETESGKTYKVPQELKDGHLRLADYTRKTQETAILQRQATTALEQQALQAQFQQATAQEQQRLSQIQAELQRFKTVDWTNLDTETYIKTRGYIDQLKDESQELERGIGGKAQQFQQRVSQMDKQAAANAYALIKRHVPDWTPDSQTEREVADYANNYGVPPEALAKVAKLFPGLAVMAHKASQFDRLQTSKGSAVQKAQKAPPVIRPGAVTSTNSAAAQKTRDIEGRFRKSGGLDDFAKLLMAKGMVK
jgi:hypothetical protein